MNPLSRLRPYELFLWFLSALGFFGINGIFLFYVIFQPEAVYSAFQNPVGLVFMIEAFFLVAVGAGLIWLYDFKRPGWLAFVILSVVGSLAFSVPFFLLLHLRKGEDDEAPSGYHR